MVEAGEYIFPEEWKKIKHDNRNYIYSRILGKGGCGVVCEFIEEYGSHRMAVKVETLTSTQTSVRTLMSEELTIMNLWRKKSDNKHLPKCFGSHVLPVEHLKFELLETSLDAYLK